jgi:DNA mismatch repair protein MutS
MAGMPKKVLDRANQILQQLESQREAKGTNDEVRMTNKKANAESSIINRNSSIDNDMQLSFFQLNDPVLENIKDELQKTDINTLTPVEALMKLNEIKKMIGG